MPIKHKFVSAKSDSADTTLIRPSNWNDDHDIDITTADVPDSSDKRYVTEAEKTKLSNLSGTNTGDQNLFSTIAVSGQSNIVADSTSDTLTLVAGSNITLTTNASTDTLTISATDTTGVTGSGTTNELAYWTGAASIGSLTTATYPSLTELSYVKGVTSAIQTQINAKFTLPSLTSGSILFSNGTTITQDNANLFWDNTNKRLGISTTSPLTKLHIADSATATTRGIVVHQHGANTSGSSLLFRKSRGTATSPSVIVNGDFMGGLRMGGYSGTQWLDAIARVDAVANGTITTSSIPTDLAFYTGTTTNGTERMRIFSDGNVSIGSTTNTNRLFTRATVNAASGTVTGIYGSTEANGDGATQYAVRARASVLGATSSLYMKHYGVLAEMIERTSAFNASLSEAYGVYAKVTGSGVNMSKIGIFVDTMNGGSLYPLSTNANYGIIASGGLNIFHSTTEQVRVAYDSSNYASFTVGSTGTMTIGGAGSAKAVKFDTDISIGFYGVTPIARPTTGSGSATFSASSGTTVNDASTFDGYTIKQVVKALRDFGLLT